MDDARALTLKAKVVKVRRRLRGRPRAFIQLRLQQNRTDARAALSAISEVSAMPRVGGYGGGFSMGFYRRSVLSGVYIWIYIYACICMYVI